MKFIELILLLIFYGVIPFGMAAPFSNGVKIIVIATVSVLYLVMLFKGAKLPVKSRRLSLLKRGTRLMWTAGAAILPEIAIITIIAVCSRRTAVFVAPIIFSLVFGIITFFVGFIKTAIGSKQIKIADYILLFIFWWVPILNFVLIRRIYKKGEKEFYFELAKSELENARAENEICKTKYPIVMVHGIFFRDWQYMNYWGRVPATLIRNGASVFYGDQQSAKSIPESAEELKTRIMEIIAETGAEKVNIIAHSKGGLDSRYAISTLGLGEYVATLTTINTPHKGSDMAEYLLGKLPKKIVNFIADKYNFLFHKLGDKDPDFLAGVTDLSTKRIAELEPFMEDVDGVSYRSCMSVMKNVFSAGFPLNVGYLLIKKLNGRNDGLVWEGAAQHGSFKLVTASGTRGISHGDTIDLFRENIDGYDVREFYANLVAELKQQGY